MLSQFQLRPMTSAVSGRKYKEITQAKHAAINFEQLPKRYTQGIAKKDYESSFLFGFVWFRSCFTVSTADFFQWFRRIYRTKNVWQINEISLMDSVASENRYKIKKT